MNSISPQMLGLVVGDVGLMKTPGPGEYQGSRYSLAFFCQANRDAVIEGPARKYEPMTAEDYLSWRINANFAKY